MAAVQLSESLKLERPEKLDYANTQKEHFWLFYQKKWDLMDKSMLYQTV